MIEKEYSGVCRICEKRTICKSEYLYPNCLVVKDPYWHKLDGKKVLMTMKDAEELADHFRISDRFFRKCDVDEHTEAK